MGLTTAIEWCDSSANPIWGCDGCELWVPKKGIEICYAGRMIERREGKGSFANVRYYPDRADRALAWPDRTGQARTSKPWLSGLPRVIFWNDMSDSFGAARSSFWLDERMVERMVASPHVHVLLTKRSMAMNTWASNTSELDGRWWLGVSVTRQRALSRVQDLAEIRLRQPTARLFVSVEPAQDEIDLTPWLEELDWVIWGGESGPRARPAELDWARRLREDCAQAGVAFFMKQAGSASASRTKKGGWEDLPEDLRIREMPQVAPVKMEIEL